MPHRPFAPLLLAALLVPSAATAATWTVCDSGCDHDSIQDAIDAASDGDTVEVGAGTWDEALVVSGTDLAIVGSGADTTLLATSTGTEAWAVDGAAVEVEDLAVRPTGGQRCFEVGAGSPASLTLRSVEIAGCEADDRGAGVDLHGGSALHIEDSLLEDCLAPGGTDSTRGGAIHVGTDAAAVLRDTTVTGTQATEGSGVYVDGGTLEVHGCVFDANVGERAGADVFATGGALVEVDDSTLSGAWVEEGGASIMAIDSDLVLTGTRFEGFSTDGDGAIGWIDEQGQELWVVDCTFADNLAEGFGGALSWDGRHADSLLAVSGSVFERNWSSSGAAIHAVGDSGTGAIWLEDNELSGTDRDAMGSLVEVSEVGALTGARNLVHGSATGLVGGGLHLSSVASARWSAGLFRDLIAAEGGAVFAQDTRLDLANNTFLDNDGGSAGALSLTRCDVEMVGNLVVGTAGLGMRVDQDLGGTSLLDYNLWSDNAGGHLEVVSSGLGVGTHSLVDVDPLLDGALPERLSPAIDAGDPSVLDLDGSRSDIGHWGGPDADPALWIDHDGDGFVVLFDCNDRYPAIHPGAPELCDGLDDDCDGEVDEGVDEDGDGDGLSACEGDCAPDDGEAYPGAEERCNGVADSCAATVPVDELDLDGDGYVACDLDDPWLGDPEVAGGGDCDALDPDLHPATIWYLDRDEDGYGDSTSPSEPSCTAPAGHTLDGGDCDDDDPDESPDATWYADSDGDGFGDPDVVMEQCARPDDYVASSGDCDDDTSRVYPGAPEICDGLIDDCEAGVLPDEEADADDDGWVVCEPEDWDGVEIDGGGDCDDADERVHPGATELCDGLVDDCDALALPLDEVDLDGDGYVACTLDDGGWDGVAVAGGDDCDALDGTVYPGAHEACDGQVNACGTTLSALEVDGDGDHYVDCEVEVWAGDGTVLGGGDCHDGDPTIHPGAVELCDGVVDDCDADVLPGWEVDDDGDGYVECPIDAGGWDGAPVDGGGDCDDEAAAIHPGAIEICDDGDADEDCDGLADDEDEAQGTATWFPDFDADGFGMADHPGEALCDGREGWVRNDFDCDDLQPDAYPGGVEVAYDGVDQDCDGDDLCDADGDGFDAVPCLGTDCDDSRPDVNPGEAEVWYDGLDADCDGHSDYDRDHDGFDTNAHGGTDCNDNRSAIHPGAVDIAGDGIDQDCDGADARSGCSSVPVAPSGVLVLVGLLAALARRRTGARLGLAIPAVGLALSSQARADTLEVCTDGCTHDTIAAAVAAASDGDLIQVDAGDWDESVDLVGKDLTLAGAGSLATVLVTSSGEWALRVRDAVAEVRDLGVAPAAEVRGIYVDERSGESTDLTLVSVAVDSCELSGSSGAGLLVRGGSTLVVEQSAFHDNVAISTGDPTHGGAIHVTGARTAVTLREVGFSVNQANLGGAIHVDGGKLTVEECSFVDDVAQLYGGQLSTQDATLVVEDSTLSGGWSFGNGAAIHAVDTRVVLRRTTVEEGYTLGHGAVYWEGGPKLVIEDSALVDNSSVGGGAGVYWAGSPEGTLSVTGSRFEGNLAGSGFEGGGLWAGGGGEVVVQGCSFTDHAASEGAGAWFGGLDLVEVSGCTFEGGTADSGGAASVVDVTTTTWTNDLFHHNGATEGGALHLLRTDAALSNNTFLDNVASAGSAAWVGSATTVAWVNGLASGSGTGLDLDPDGGPHLIHHGLFHGHDVHLASDGVEVDGDHPDNLFDLDPQLDARALPRPGSPAIDAGDPTVVDPDGTRSDIGHWGGPGADPDLYLDLDGDGWVVVHDCNDLLEVVHPGATELFDGLDDDCDGEVDEDADVDLDGDGHTPRDGDCAPADGSTYPGAAELCDGVVTDCDRSWPLPVELDGDGDGYVSCTPVAGWAGASILGGGDCDDDDPELNPETEWIADADGDGYGDDAGVTTASCEQPDGFASTGGDCDDDDPSEHPGAVWYADEDEDGFGDAGEVVSACERPEGRVPAAGDCDDEDDDTFPGAPQLCDGVANDCGVPLPADETDDDEDGWVECEPWMGDDGVDGGGDCDDDDETTYPGAAEACDGVITDCTTTALPLDEADVDGDGWVACYMAGTGWLGDPEMSGGGDCDDLDASVHPTAIEVCDGLDTDCDATLLAAEVDDDGDGWVECAVVGWAGEPVRGGTDCDDADPTVAPLATELCDGKVNTCGGALPDDEVDDDGDGWVECAVDAGGWDGAPVDGGGDCDDDAAGVYPGALEVCDEDDVDEDCDGLADDEDGDAMGGLLRWPDFDGDGFGMDVHVGEVLCDPPLGWVDDHTDCDDLDPAAYPGAEEIPYDRVDQDCDTEDLCDVDEDGYPAEVCGGADCADLDPRSHPGAVEIWYDGADQDCDGGSDWDADGDGWDSVPGGGADCNDLDADVHPLAEEIPGDGVDQDCDGDDARGGCSTSPAAPATWLVVLGLLGVAGRRHRRAGGLSAEGPARR